MDDQRASERLRLQRFVASQPSLAAAARSLGLPPSTLRTWIRPTQRGACAGCGASLAGRDAIRCRRCEAQRRRRFSDRQLLAARARWMRRYGRSPSSYDWNPSVGPHFRKGDWPPAATVLRRFRTWDAFLAAEAPGYPGARSE